MREDWSRNVFLESIGVTASPLTFSMVLLIRFCYRWLVKFLLVSGSVGVQSLMMPIWIDFHLPHGISFIYPFHMNTLRSHGLIPVLTGEESVCFFLTYGALRNSVNAWSRVHELLRVFLWRLIPLMVLDVFHWMNPCVCGDWTQVDLRAECKWLHCILHIEEPHIEHWVYNRRVCGRWLMAGVLFA